jgi:hypothetical protein
MIVKGSQLCEESENVVTFIVTEVTTDKPIVDSVGSHLSLLCLKCAPVAEGFLLWARAKCNGNEFAESAPYPTLAPGILSLARIIAKHHPFSREDVIDLAVLFLHHSSSEVSPQKMYEIKEKSLRLLLIVATQGLAINVFQIVSRKVKQGVIDSNLIRYFVSGTLEIVRPPVSISFVHAFGELLSSKACIDAINSNFFEEKKKGILVKLLKSFPSHASDVKFTGARKMSFELIGVLQVMYNVK